MIARGDPKAVDSSFDINDIISSIARVSLHALRFTSIHPYPHFRIAHHALSYPGIMLHLHDCE